MRCSFCFKFFNEHLFISAFYYYIYILVFENRALTLRYINYNYLFFSTLSCKCQEMLLIIVRK